MNIKKVLCFILVIGVLGHTSLTFALEDSLVLSEGEEVSETELIIEELPPEEESDPEESIDLLALTSADEEGKVTIPESGLLDFLFPEEINGELVYRIGPGAFQGCEFLRTVAIPATVTEIGEEAFSNCPNLEQIILLDRSDDSDLLLGENWAGDAQVIFELPAEEEEETEIPVEEEETLEEDSAQEDLPADPTDEEDTTVPETGADENTGEEEIEQDETPNTEEETETSPAPEICEEDSAVSDPETNPPSTEEQPDALPEVTEEPQPVIIQENEVLPVAEDPQPEETPATTEEIPAVEIIEIPEAVDPEPIEE